MKIALYILALTLALHLPARAQTTHRVSFGMNLQNVIDNSSPNDIIIIEAGDYGDIIVAKKLYIYGPGYFLQNNYNGGNQLSSTVNIGKLTIDIGSSGTSVTGIKAGTVYISSSNVSLLRSYLSSITIGLKESDNSNIPTSNNYIAQCLITEGAIIKSNSVNFYFKNNLFARGFSIESDCLGEFLYNTFNYDISGSESYNSMPGSIITVKNNIFLNYINTWNSGTSCSGPQYFPFHLDQNNVIVNNLFFKNIYAVGLYNSCISGESEINIPLNVRTTDQNSILIGYPTNTNDEAIDARCQLAPNSPAKGAGEGGTDAGAFGGDDPYVLSGTPEIPSIYHLQVPATVSQGGTLQVQIKAKTNN